MLAAELDQGSDTATAMARPSAMRPNRTQPSDAFESATVWISGIFHRQQPAQSRFARFEQRQRFGENGLQSRIG
jgi:hypothetical protein